jgi:hypothetical protein
MIKEGKEMEFESLFKVAAKAKECIYFRIVT